MALLRKEVQNYLLSCEHLLAAASTPNSTTFLRRTTSDRYYSTELSPALALCSEVLDLLLLNHPALRLV